jgi:hypothetical protein
LGIIRGAFFHIATFDGNGFRVIDLWEMANAFDAIVKNRLIPGVKQLGIRDEPKMEMHPTHAIFAPAYQPKWIQRSQASQHIGSQAVRLGS